MAAGAAFVISDNESVCIGLRSIIYFYHKSRHSSAVMSMVVLFFFGPALSTFQMTTRNK